MSKKRRRGGQAPVSSGPGELKKSESKLKAITTYGDVADSEDEFFINQDKILLDGARSARSKQQYGDDMLEFSDHEVLEDELSDSDVEEMDEELQEPERKQNLKSIQVKDGDKKRPASSDDGDENNPEEEEEVEGWGRSKRDYYNQDEIETERDALEEEQEALRLQQKRLKQRNEADFGLDDDDWFSGTKASDGRDLDQINDLEAVTQTLPDVEITEEMGPAERKRLLDLHFPEFDPLAKEFLALQSLHVELAAASERRESANVTIQQNQDFNAVNVTGLKYEALTAYLGALSMYFALLTSATSAGGKSVLARSSSEIREHPIMETLVACRQTWESFQDLEEPAVPPAVDGSRPGQAPVEDQTAELPKPVSTETKQRPRKSRKRKRQTALEVAQAENERQRTERLRKTEEELAALSSLTTNHLKTRQSKLSNVVNTNAPLRNDDSDLGEDTSLTPFEAAEKARKKKTLRFYTSQIAQKANKRTNAGRDAGGDTDIPVRERLRDRQVRLNAQAEKRGKKRGNVTEDALDAGGDDEDPETGVNNNVKGRDDDEEYYDMIAASTKKRKLAKEESSRHASNPLDNNGPQYLEEGVGPDGKRAITYAIEKNKGLAPKRKKDVRNPRVKKRKKFAEKSKKLASMRQVYKGGEQRGGYGGEATGIKIGLVKSIKL
ncbi:MAG: hypothetical protein M1823_004390 [Watsoniomyces obsoletus]|nr:MAG: hypothetical protein M1823_004390 [Watsoniomyces obsoletus]